MMRWAWVVCGMVIGAQLAGAAEMPAVRFELVAKVEERPVFLTHDSKGRLFILEQPGRVREMGDAWARETDIYFTMARKP